MPVIEHHSKVRGFTLIEFIIVITLVGIIAAIGTKIISQAFDSYFASTDLIASDWQAQIALERMQRDIRAIMIPTSITTASATQLVFVNTSGEAITYSLSGTTLNRRTNSNTVVPLAFGVQSLGFTYFDRNGIAAGALANIRFITINLTITLNNTNYAVRTSVYGRNLP